MVNTTQYRDLNALGELEKDKYVTYLSTPENLQVSLKFANENHLTEWK